MKFNLSELLETILPGCESDTELDHRLLEECRDRFGDEHAAAYKAISDLLDRRAPEHSGSRLGAAIAMADTSSRIQFGTTVNRQVYSSLDEMPPEIRERAEKMMREGKGTMVTDNVLRWDSRDGTPPPPEIAEKIRAHMRTERADAPGLRVQVSSGGMLKWILILIVLLLIVGVALIIMVLRGNVPTETSLTPGETMQSLTLPRVLLLGHSGDEGHAHKR